MANAERGAAILDEAASKPKLSAAKSHLGAVQNLWERGLPRGSLTGWPSVDPLYTVAPGQMTIVTGWPSSGKSEWLDALLVNLARQSWKFAMFSFENQPVQLHISKLLEKFTGKPFGDGPTERMSAEEVEDYTEVIDQSFAFADAAHGALTAKEIIEEAEGWLSKFPNNPRGLVIDPWNEIEHWRPVNLSETEYVSATLSYIRRWARKHSVHVWVVAHPQKVRREEGKLPIPRPDMISGSQHWWNKADCCVTVYRDFEKPDSRDIDVHVQKCRFKHIGKIGLATLRYDVVTGRYSELPPTVMAYRRATNGE